MKRTLIRGRAFLALLGTLALASVSQAQAPDGDDIPQTVVRVAYFSGQVSYSRGDDPDAWQPASLNFPMTLGDRLYTAKGSRLELQTEGGAIYLAPETDLAALNLTLDVKQFSLGIGAASFHIRRVDSGESFEVDTPNSAITFDRPGDYRIDVDRDGNTRVIVNRGHAYVAAAGGEVPLGAGQLMAIDGIDSPVYDVTALPRRDSWDQWVQTRSQRFRDAGRYVNQDISGVDDLNQYGRWSQLAGYGTCWSPANVAAGWQPYRAGRWTWQDPWGWSWVSNEPWGWAPYHYGRWVTSQSRWYWVPVGPDVRSVRYAPALVAFVGGPGLSLSVSGGGGPGGAGGYVGWFPLAPRDPFVPWWGSGARATSVTNVTYVNRTYVTVVNQNTFVSGAPVGTNLIRDARTVREITAAPVVRGPIQVVPLASSIRVSTQRAGSAPRPPAAALTRAVVTRLAPPPAPAPFREKASLIKENRGAPVAPAQAARLPVASQAIRPIRPVAGEGGRVTLAPKNAKSAGLAPVPVTRAVLPGQTRSAPAPEQQQRQAVDTQKNQQQQAESARKVQQQQQAIDAQKQQRQAVDTQKQQQQAESARKAQQQQQQQAVDTQKQQQQAESARKAQKQQQQQAVDTQKQQQQAESARKAQKQQQQQAVDTQKQQQQAESARKAQQQQQQAVDTQKKQQQAESARKAQQQQQQAVDTQKQQQAESARKAQQQQQAESARKVQQQQQQAVDSQKQQQQAESARKVQQQQQQAVDSQKQQQQAESARKAQQQQQAESARKVQSDAKDQQAAAKRKAAEDQKKEKKPPAEEEKR
jgi:hypothetical protein